MLTDEYFDEKLHMQRVKMSMRRNILRRVGCNKDNKINKKIK